MSNDGQVLRLGGLLPWSVRSGAVFFDANLYLLNNYGYTANIAIIIQKIKISIKKYCTAPHRPW